MTIPTLRLDFTLTADEIAAISALNIGAEKRADSNTGGHWRRQPLAVATQLDWWHRNLSGNCHEPQELKSPELHLNRALASAGARFDTRGSMSFPLVGTA